MVFSSSTFLFFFLPFTLLGYFLLHPRYRNAFLLLASLFFYAWGEPKFVLVMLLSIFANYLFALWIDRFRGNHQFLVKAAVVCAVIFNIGILTIFKYANFITGNLGKLLPQIQRTSIALPIGISFFTFQALSYVIDVARGEKVQRNPLNIGLYISFFPQLIAGPIVRYHTIEAEIRSRSVSWDGFSDGCVRFLIGLFKKILLANNLALVADAAFAAPVSTTSVCFSWLGALAYTLQIYYDFSGYSDMAIGLGRMFGFHFNENFNYPYTAKSVTDFWRRWHISLSSWFRDYVYIPLGGSRVNSVRKHLRNLFVVWLLTGIWHGASWNFIAWGLMYFVFLAFEKYVLHPERFSHALRVWTYRVITFLIVMFGWVLFRAAGFSGAFYYVKSMFGLYGNPFIDLHAQFYSREYLVIILLAALFSFPVYPKLAELYHSKSKLRPLGIVKSFAFVFLFIAAISYLVMGSHNPFIYYHF